MASSENRFIDYYELLQVHPACDDRTLEIAFHYLAKMYHPDNLSTSDVEKFNDILTGYRILKDPEKRAQYDREHTAIVGRPAGNPAPELSHDIDAETAVRDAQFHSQILFQLYARRRQRTSDPGVAGWLLQEGLGCSEEQFDFHVWYLKSKGLLEVTEQGTLAITIQGVDQVIATSERGSQTKFLLAHSPDDLKPPPG